MALSQNSEGASATSILGEMVWLYSMSEMHRTWPITSIHQWLLPPILHNQFKLYRRDQKPVGLVTWAQMTPETEAAYVRNTRSLQPNDWVGGERKWIIDFIAPFGDAKQISQDLRANVFPKETARALRGRKGSDTLRVVYVRGKGAVTKPFKMQVAHHF